MDPTISRQQRRDGAEAMGGKMGENDEEKRHQ